MITASAVAVEASRSSSSSPSRHPMRYPLRQHPTFHNAYSLVRASLASVISHRAHGARFRGLAVRAPVTPLARPWGRRRDTAGRGHMSQRNLLDVSLRGLDPIVARATHAVRCSLDVTVRIAFRATRERCRARTLLPSAAHGPASPPGLGSATLGLIYKLRRLSSMTPSPVAHPGTLAVLPGLSAFAPAIPASFSFALISSCSSP